MWLIHIYCWRCASMTLARGNRAKEGRWLSLANADLRFKTRGEFTKQAGSSDCLIIEYPVHTIDLSCIFSFHYFPLLSTTFFPLYVLVCVQDGAFLSQN